jgi:GNAT superfamily N-acetyltransferase
MQNTEALSFRDAGAADVPAIVALVQSAYRGEASRTGWTTEADLLDGQRIDPEGVLEVIGKPDSRVLLAERGGELLACCHLEKQGDGCYFGMFAVAPNGQGKGAGKATLAEAERVGCERWHCRELRMTVIDVREDLINWYERRGYHRTGEHAPFPYGDVRFGIPKRDDLQFAWLAKSLRAERVA